MVDDLTKVQETIALGKRAQGISRQNIVFSVLVLAVLIPGALIGILKIAAAVVAHKGSELPAIGNSLRVRQG